MAATQADNLLGIELYRDRIVSLGILLNISRRSVQYIIKKFKLTGDVKDRPKSGRNCLLSDREVRRLVRISKGTPTWTAREVRQEANMENLVSLGTVRRTLRRNGLFGRIAIRKPYLSEGHRKKRFAWSQDRLSWSVEKWGNVVFSDECKLELNPNRRMYVRRNIGARLKAKYIRSTVKFPRYIMVWGAIRGDGARVIVRCNRNVDSLEYQRVLRVGLPHVYCPGCAFQQDGAPPHYALTVRKYLNERNVLDFDSWIGRQGGVEYPPRSKSRFDSTGLLFLGLFEKRGVQESTSVKIWKICGIRSRPSR